MRHRRHGRRAEVRLRLGAPQPTGPQRARSAREVHDEGPLTGKNVELIGRADPRGEAEYNMNLGATRANAVKHYLAQLGITPSRFTTTSRGSLDAQGHDEASWAVGSSRRSRPRRPIAAVQFCARRLPKRAASAPRAPRAHLPRGRLSLSVCARGLGFKGDACPRTHVRAKNARQNEWNDTCFVSPHEDPHDVRSPLCSSLDTLSRSGARKVPSLRRRCPPQAPPRRLPRPRPRWPTRRSRVRLSCR